MPLCTDGILWIMRCSQKIAFGRASLVIGRLNLISGPFIQAKRICNSKANAHSQGAGEDSRKPCHFAEVLPVCFVESQIKLQHVYARFTENRELAL